MADFATADDLEAAWRPLDSDERARADKLLEYASARIRSAVKTIDSDIAAGKVSALDAEMVAVDMVKRAMSVPVDGVEQTSEAAGPFSESRTYANPTGALFLTKSEVRSLGGTSKGKAFTVDATPSPTGPLDWPDDYRPYRYR